MFTCSALIEKRQERGGHGTGSSQVLHELVAEEPERRDRDLITTLPPWCARSALCAYAHGLHDLVVGAANQHMEAVVRGGLLSLPTEYLPVVVAAGSYYVHPYDLTAVGAGDWNRGLQFLSTMVAAATEPA